MTTIRSTHLLRRAVGLAALPALLLTAAACGDDASGESAGGSFCEEARDLDTTFADADPSDPEAFNDAISAFRDLDAPAEIEDDWAAFLEAAESFEDPSSVDPAAIDDLQTSVDNVLTYLSEECDIDTE